MRSKSFLNEHTAGSDRSQMTAPLKTLHEALDLLEEQERVVSGRLEALEREREEKKNGAHKAVLARMRDRMRAEDWMMDDGTEVEYQAGKRRVERREAEKREAEKREAEEKQAGPRVGEVVTTMRNSQTDPRIIGR